MTARDRIRQRATAAKPKGTASEASEVSGVWSRPAVPAYLPFPVGDLPERVQPFAWAVAESTNTDPAFTALPLLSLLGATVGTSRAVMPKKRWRVFPCVWGACLGSSGSGKSPPLAVLNDCLDPLVDELEDENRDALDSHHEAKARHLADRSKKGLPPPPEPAAKRIRVKDTTVQALAVILHANPRGVWMPQDELAGWFGSFTRCSNSRENADRPQWLSLFDGGSLEVDRKTGDPKHISVRNTMAAVVGCIQPKIAKAAMTEENVGSGLFARLLVAYPPDRLTEWSDAEVSDSLAADLTALLRALRRFEPTEIDGRRVPVLNVLHPDALAMFKTFFNENRRRAFSADDAEAAATVKLESYALRFAHIRHLCRHAGRDDSTPITPEDMAAGIRLAEWFLNEYHRVRALLGEPERMQGQRRLVAWIRNRGGKVTIRDLQKTDHRRYPDATAARARLEQLAADGFGEWQDVRGGNGRMVTYFVLHPDTPPDAGHYQTLRDGEEGESSDTVPDTSPGPESQTLSGQGDYGEVSGSVQRLVGVESSTAEVVIQRPPKGEVSGTQPEPLPAEFYRSGHPSVAPMQPPEAAPDLAPDPATRPVRVKGKRTRGEVEQSLLAAIKASGTTWTEFAKRPEVRQLRIPTLLHRCTIADLEKASAVMEPAPTLTGDVAPPSAPAPKKTDKGKSAPPKPAGESPADRLKKQLRSAKRTWAEVAAFLDSKDEYYPPDLELNGLIPAQLAMVAEWLEGGDS